MEQQNEKISYSFSKISTYDKCPANFYWRHITYEAKDEGHEAAQSGTAIHEALDKRMSEKIPLPAEAEAYEDLCQAIEDSSGFAEYLYEQELTILADGTPTNWSDSEALLRAKVDVLLIGEADRTSWIIDWKTGKRKAQYVRFDQLELNALMVWECYPQVDRIKVTYAWIKENHLEEPRLYTREKHYDKLWRKYMKKIDTIEDSIVSGHWPAKPSGLCPWCPSRSICPDARL